MGVFEYFLVTPSHHRVHHAINPVYMDKNYSQIFIIWDRLFGTFQKELASEPAVYGINRAAHTWNPWIINYQHLWLLFKDAWRTASWWDKVRIWFMPTGWRPIDVEAMFPVSYTKDIYNRPKYETQASVFFQYWSFFQLVITLLFMMFLFNNIGEIRFDIVLLYGAFLFVSVFAYTSMMDGDLAGVIAELIRFGLAMLLFYFSDFTWFGIDAVISGGSFIVLGYLILSLTLSLFFYFGDRPVAVLE
jgi:hypothetical protein